MKGINSRELFTVQSRHTTKGRALFTDMIGPRHLFAARQLC